MSTTVTPPAAGEAFDEPQGEYRVDLDVFFGPLDLLLYLVRKHEVDVLDIPIATITEQYLKHLDVLAAVDLDLAGDFLVMAATLIELKSRMLLPRAEEDDLAEDDPRAELVQQLLEYKKFKDASSMLRERARLWEQHYPRLGHLQPEEKKDPTAEPIQQVELWDLVSAFDRLMRETLAAAPATVVYDETPIEVHMQEIERRLAAQQRVRFGELFTGATHRVTIVGIFLALLELVRLLRVRVEQAGDFGEIWISHRAHAADGD